MDGVDYYELLGVRRDASATEIKSAYRALARSMHPDAGGTSGTFRLLREAYETLGDPERRADYDAGDDEPGEVVEAVVPEPARTAAAFRGRERRRTARARDFGEDPGFTPAAPTVDTGTIPWWDDVPAGEPIHCVPRRGPGHAPGLAALGAVVLLLVPLLLGMSPPTPVLVGWLALLAGAIAAVVLLSRRYRDAIRADRAFTAEFGEQVVAGTAGAEADQLAERLTADLLARYLTRLPGARIFHGLSWPGSVFADVDHAVLCGRRLVLVESKMWLPGHYTVDASGGLRRNGNRFRGGGSRLAESVAAFRELLPRVEVRAALVVYPSRAGTISTGEPAGVTVPPMTPEGFVREIGGWLAEDPCTVDRDVFRAVHGQVV